MASEYEMFDMRLNVHKKQVSNTVKNMTLNFSVSKIYLVYENVLFILFNIILF